MSSFYRVRRDGGGGWLNRDEGNGGRRGGKGGGCGQKGRDFGAPDILCVLWQKNCWL